jgi:hypothetical protein
MKHLNYSLIVIIAVGGLKSRVLANKYREGKSLK